MTGERIAKFIVTRSASFAEREAFELNTLKLSDIVGASSPPWLHSRLTGSAAVLVIKLIDYRLALADESFAQSVTEELAVFLVRESDAANARQAQEIAAGDIRGYSHQGGRLFWHLLSGEVEFYADILAQLGRQARERRQTVSAEISRACNRMTRDFIDKYTTGGLCN